MGVPATKEELQALLLEVSFTRNFGFRVQSIESGKCTLEVPFQEAFERPGGIISGQVFMAAADVAMWLAIMTTLGKQDESVTTEMKTTFLSAARREVFYSTANILKLGRRLIYGTAECANGEGKVLTHHTITYIRPEHNG